MKLLKNAHSYTMNNKLSLIYLIFIITAVLPACRGPVSEGNNNTSASPQPSPTGDEKYVVVDTKQSVVTWKGGMQMGTNSHTGYVYISKGELMMDDNELMGGTVEVDMNTIEDEKYGSDNGLIEHLKDPDFFDVKKFPTSTIAITKVEPANDGYKKIIGNLTIKGITHPVSFAAKVEMNNGIVNANGKLVIDRTDWGIRYKSGKFYALLADETMSDSIEFNIKIVAKSK